MDVLDLVRDRLGPSGYGSLVAEAYDTWLPPDGEYTDVGMWRDMIAGGEGPALELGCGNGRLLLGYVAEGLDVEGVDASADMLAICRAHAAARGLKVVVHHADWMTLDLPRRFATIYNPAGSFALLPDDDAARTGIEVWMRHLAPGGRLAITMCVPAADLDANYDWRVRRSATRDSDGVTFMVHEAFRYDRAQQVQHVLNKHEVWDAHGQLLTTFMSRTQIRWWTPEQLTALLHDAGAVDVAVAGPPSDFRVTARSRGIGRSPW